MVSLDGNLNLSAMWFEELFTCSRDELEVSDDKELTEEALTSIWKVLIMCYMTVIGSSHVKKKYTMEYLLDYANVTVILGEPSRHKLQYLERKPRQHA